MIKTKTAGIIIIGNEILSGKVQDTNSFFLASELRKLGVDVKHISVIPDKVETIGSKAVEFSKRYDYVFSAGGIGPTHDDVTMAGIAGGFGVRLIRNPEIKKMLSSRYSGFPNDAVLKMSEVPEGAEVVFRKDMRFPVVSFNNIFIFPGIPEHLKNKFSLIKEQFRSSRYYLKQVYLNANESDIAETLNTIVSEHSDVLFGSYPVLGKSEYRVLVTVESRVKVSLNKALYDLKSRLPEEILVRIE